MWNESGQELLAYHWHPTAGSRVRAPHLHVRASLLPTDSVLQSAHLLTGYVVLEDVVQGLIEELSIRPRRRHHHDWSSILEQSRREFEVGRT